jgi:exosome complex RNA-binding protein Rrp4
MIGRNGYAWVKGGDMNLLQVALARIDDESHHANLTNRMTEFLRQKPINSALKGVEQ